MRMRIAAAALVAALAGHAAHGQVFSACGADAASITPTLDSFRAALGGALNPNVAGSFGSGRREINWDGVPSPLAAPNNLPADFFNVASPRGAVFATPGTGFQVSANAGDAATLFGTIDASYPTQFAAFSPQRLFTPLGSNVADVLFFVPGSTTPATVAGFGAVFTDVDAPGLTGIQWFDAFGGPIAQVTLSTEVTNTAGKLCFLGGIFPGRVGRVRITGGNATLAPGVPDQNGDINDLVVTDDFVYGEPTAVAEGIPALGTWGLAALALLIAAAGLWVRR
jgi:hypothetical protein